MTIKLMENGLKAIVNTIYKSMPRVTGDLSKSDRYELIVKVLMNQDYIDLNPETDIDLLEQMITMLVAYYE